MRFNSVAIVPRSSFCRHALLQIALSYAARSPRCPSHRRDDEKDDHHGNHDRRDKRRSTGADQPCAQPRLLALHIGDDARMPRADSFGVRPNSPSSDSSCEASRSNLSWACSTIEACCVRSASIEMVGSNVLIAVLAASSRLCVSRASAANSPDNCGVAPVPSRAAASSSSCQRRPHPGQRAKGGIGGMLRGVEGGQRRRSGLRIERHKTTFRCRSQNGGKLHATSQSRIEDPSTPGPSNVEVTRANEGAAPAPQEA